METEHIYTIPLRDVKIVPRWRRANKAVSMLRGYLSRHMKTEAENVKLDSKLNEVLWSRSGQKPPLKVRVKAIRQDDGIVFAEYAGDR